MMTLALVIANDVLKMRKVIDFQNWWIVVYYKIHFCVLLQPVCAGEVSVATTAWKVSKYGVNSGPCFLVFGLNTEIYSVNLRIQSKYRKYGPEITPYLDTFHAASLSRSMPLRMGFVNKKVNKKIFVCWTCLINNWLYVN